MRHLPLALVMLVGIATAATWPSGAPDDGWSGFKEGSSVTTVTEMDPGNPMAKGTKESSTTTFTKRERMIVGKREIDCAVYEAVSSDDSGKEKSRSTMWRSNEVPGGVVKASWTQGGVKTTITCTAFDARR